MVKADRKKLIVVSHGLNESLPLERGSSVWYVDRDTGDIGEGEISVASYRNGKLCQLSVDFEDNHA